MQVISHDKEIHISLPKCIAGSHFQYTSSLYVSQIYCFFSSVYSFRQFGNLTPIQ